MLSFFSVVVEVEVVVVIVVVLGDVVPDDDDDGLSRGFGGMVVEVVVWDGVVEVVVPVLW